jgi:flagellar protein FliO/FliZ
VLIGAEVCWDHRCFSIAIGGGQTQKGDSAIKKQMVYWMAIKRYRIRTALGLLFFYLLTALCPIGADAQPKNRTRNQKNPGAVQVAPQVTPQVTPKVTPKEEKREQSSVAIDSDNNTKEIESTKKAESKDDAGQANGFGQYSDYRSEDAESASYGWLIFKTLIIIGLLVGGFYYFFRFVTKKTGIQLLGKDVAHVLSVVPLGPNRYLQVVDIAGRVLVLGVTDTNINFITEITEKDEIDRIRVMSASAPSPEAPTFSDFISKQIGRFLEKRESRKSHVAEPDEDRLEYLARQRERLKKIRGEIDGA